jgi:hypothetical protein
MSPPLCAADAVALEACLLQREQGFEVGGHGLPHWVGRAGRHVASVACRPRLRKTESAPAGEMVPLAFALRGADTAPSERGTTFAIPGTNREDLQ